VVGTLTASEAGGIQSRGRSCTLVVVIERLQGNFSAYSGHSRCVHGGRRRPGRGEAKCTSESCLIEGLRETVRFAFPSPSSGRDVLLKGHPEIRLPLGTGYFPREYGRSSRRPPRLAPTVIGARCLLRGWRALALSAPVTVRARGRGGTTGRGGVEAINQPHWPLSGVSGACVDSGR